MVVGNRLSHAGEQAVAKAERLAETVGARIHGEPLMSEVSVSTDHENWVSTLDNTTSGMAEEVDTDTIAFVGCSTEAPAFFTGKPVIEDSATVIQVGGDAGDVSNVYPVDVPVVGQLSDAIGQILDAAERDGPDEPSEHRETTPGVGTVLEVIGQLVGTSERSGTGGTPMDRIETIAEKRREALAAIEANAPETDGRPSKPELCRTVDDVVDNEVLVVEGITTGFMLRELVSIGHDQLQGLKSGGLGYGFPAAVGAAVAEDHGKEPVTC
jgi:Thiamine pyrophosphate enzyme, central domain.